MNLVCTIAQSLQIVKISMDPTYVLVILVSVEMDLVAKISMSVNLACITVMQETCVKIPLAPSDVSAALVTTCIVVLFVQILMNVRKIHINVPAMLFA